MGQNSKISWTMHTFNPWIGCQKVSAGCTHCYAETLMDKRWSKVKWGPGGTRQRTSEANWREPAKWDRAAAKAGERHRVFCASLADVFEDRPELAPWRRDLFRLIRDTPHLHWLLLTKRPENVGTLISAAVECAAFLAPLRDVWPNLWIGTSVEDQKNADARIPHLMRCSAAVRFLSVEPLLGPVDLMAVNGALVSCQKHGACDAVDEGGIHWVIAGAESGSGARPMDEAWVRRLRDQCAAGGVPFFYKQKIVDGRKVELPALDGRVWAEFPVVPARDSELTQTS